MCRIRLWGQACGLHPTSIIPRATQLVQAFVRKGRDIDRWRSTAIQASSSPLEAAKGCAKVRRSASKSSDTALRLQ